MLPCVRAGLSSLYKSAHDFFQPQPQTSAAVFYLGNILHDWSDEYCVDILSKLRAAAKPDTKLVVIDKVISYVSGDSDDVGDIPGAKTSRASPPLLPNQGHARALDYYMDMTVSLRLTAHLRMLMLSAKMLCLLNGQERTPSHFRQLFERSGWRLVQILRQPSSISQVVGVPV